MVYMQLYMQGFASFFLDKYNYYYYFPTKIQGNARITSEKCMEHVYIVGLLGQLILVLSSEKQCKLLRPF